MKAFRVLASSSLGWALNPGVLIYLFYMSYSLNSSKGWLYEGLRRGIF